MPGKNCKGTKIKVVAKSYGFLFSSVLQYALQNQKKKKNWSSYIKFSQQQTKQDFCPELLATVL